MTIWVRPTNTFRYHSTKVWSEKDFAYTDYGGIIPDGITDEEWLRAYDHWPLSGTMIRNLGGKGPADPDRDDAAPLTPLMT